MQIEKGEEEMVGEAKGKICCACDHPRRASVTVVPPPDDTGYYVQQYYCIPCFIKMIVQWLLG